MNLFVAVVMLVMVPLVCTAEDSPHPVPSPGKEGQPVQNSSQNEQQKTTVNDSPTKHLATFINQTETPNAAQVKPNPGDRPSQQPSDNWIVWLTGALVFVGIAQVVVYAMQARYMSQGLEVTRQSVKAAQDSADAAKLGAEAAKISAVAAQESVTVADRSMKVATRAYLFVKEWEILNFREDVQSKVMCRLHNAGSTPATIERQVAGYDMTIEVPPPYTPIDLRDREKGEVLVNAQGNTEIIAGTHCFMTEEYQALQGKTRFNLFLYVSTCFVYRDVFDQQHWVVSSAKYDVDNRAFVVVDRPGYNCHNVYREEDWADKNNQ